MCGAANGWYHEAVGIGRTEFSSTRQVVETGQRTEVTWSIAVWNLVRQNSQFVLKEVGLDVSAQVYIAATPYICDGERSTFRHPNIILASDLTIT